MTAENLVSQSQLGERHVEQSTRYFEDLWWRCDNHAPHFERAYTTREQTECELLLDDFLNTVTRTLKQPIRNEQQRQAVQQQMTTLGAVFAKAVFGFEDAHLEAVQSSGIVEATVEFAQQARRFDPSLSSEDIYQAARNVMTMNLLQLAMGLPVQVTPAVFAYSMLYPYSDNYLDDPSIGGGVKRAFNERFNLRLMGRPFTPQNVYEQKINTLMSMIDGQYDRSSYPLVHQSLLDIHIAQAKSLRLHQPSSSPYDVDVLGLSFEKGGTAVVADAYLVAGAPTPAQLQAAFGYGAFTQLMDDLEDVERDHADGILTVFSQTAGVWQLDSITNRLFSLGDWVLNHMQDFGSNTPQPLRDLMQRCIHLLLADSAGAVGKLYSRPYLAYLEQHMPFRFSTLKKQRQRLGRQRTSLMKLIEMSAVQDQLTQLTPLVKSHATA